MQDEWRKKREIEWKRIARELSDKVNAMNSLLRWGFEEACEKATCSKDIALLDAFKNMPRDKLRESSNATFKEFFNHVGNKNEFLAEALPSSELPAKRPFRELKF